MHRPSVGSLVFSVCLACALGLGLTQAVEDKHETVDRMQQDFELMRLLAETYEQIDSHYVTDVDRRELVEAAIRGMVSHLDQYSTYIQPEDMRRFERHIEQEFVGIGIGLNVVDGKMEIVSPLPDSPAFRAGLRTGDVIKEIEGEPTSEMSPADVARLLAGPPGRPVELSILKLSAEEAEKVIVIRDTIQVPTVVGHSRDADHRWDFVIDDEKKIGYVRVTHFSRNTADDLRVALESLISSGLSGLILDLRSNPGGLMESAIEIADMFLDTGRIVSMKGRSVPERTWKARRGGTLPPFPMVVVVNRQSASASEVLSACLQDNGRAVIVGERTWGKGSVQDVVALESGRSALKLTTASYFRPSGVNIHRFADSGDEDDWGVKPTPGYQRELTKEQWADWTRSREITENMRPQEKGQDAPEFTDLHLEDAVRCVTEMIDTASRDAAADRITDQFNPASESAPALQN